MADGNQCSRHLAPSRLILLERLEESAPAVVSQVIDTSAERLGRVAMDVSSR